MIFAHKMVSLIFALTATFTIIPNLIRVISNLLLHDKYIFLMFSIHLFLLQYQLTPKFKSVLFGT